MKERPILFSAPMVRAILDGSKTQTRRKVKLPNHPRSEFEAFDLVHGVATFTDANPFPAHVRCPYGAEGDRLWVRETFYCDHWNYPDAPRDEMVELLEYRADHDCRSWEAGCPCAADDGHSMWRSPIHMPRWASRIDLEVTEVRVERLRALTEDDARAEGLTYGDDPMEATTGREAFIMLWTAINGAGSWAANPWVWVVSFRRVRP